MQPQTKQVKQSNKSNALMKILKKKRERDADQVLKDLLEQKGADDLAAGFKHNQFGGFCLQANDLAKAEQHLFKAHDIIYCNWKIPYTNNLMNIGNFYGQKRDYHNAIKFYEQVINVSPHDKNNNCQLPQKFAFDTQKYGSVIYSSKLNSETAFIDAHTNLAVMYIQINQFQKAHDYCQKALQLQPDNHESVINFTDILRQLGKKQQAIKQTWQQIIQYTKKNTNPDYQGFKALQIKNWEKKQYDGEKKISVLSVKWGTRYPASYVNKLYSGIKRNTSWEIDFYCFTEDSKDLHPEIKIKPLEQGWKKWWGKVTLFKDHGIKGRKFYIDLDMVITGNLDEMFGYGGEFATLRTGDLECEKNHKDGYNSSVMIWNDDILVPIYEALKQNFENINKFIVRFDFWLQMTINNADYLQVVYPGQVVDFLADAKEKLPQNARVVCFARKPKPEEYPAEWIREYWVQ